MKKILFLTMALILCFSLCACNTGTQLTIENYTDYLSLGVDCVAGGERHFYSEIPYINGIPYTGHGYYEGINGAISIKGVSTNYNYEDVSVTIKFSGTYGACLKGEYKQDENFEFEVTCDTNIAGEGYAVELFDLVGGYTTQSEYIDYTYEIVEIKGSVVPVK